MEKRCGSKKGRKTVFIMDLRMFGEASVSACATKAAPLGITVSQRVGVSKRPTTSESGNVRACWHERASIWKTRAVLVKKGEAAVGKGHECRGRYGSKSLRPASQSNGRQRIVHPALAGIDRCQDGHCMAVAKGATRVRVRAWTGHPTPPEHSEGVVW